MEMTEKRYNVWDIDGTIFLEDHSEGSYHIGQVGNVDINCLNDIANRLNDLTEENEQLKAQLKDCEKRVTDKVSQWLRNNTVWEQMPSNKRTFTTTSVKEDYK